MPLWRATGRSRSMVHEWQPRYQASQSSCRNDIHCNNGNLKARENIAMPTFTPSPDQISRFHADGFFVAEKLLDAEEVELLKTNARADHEMQSVPASRGDGEVGAIRLVVVIELLD